MKAIVRVDDRLVHGQVVVGWGRARRLERIVLVDDAISTSDWEQELYRMGVPAGMEMVFTSVPAAPDGMARWDTDRTMLLVGDVATLARLCDVIPVTRVNLGGIHQAAGRRECLPYVFLSGEESVRLRALADRGITITAQDLPTTAPVPLAEVLR